MAERKRVPNKLQISAREREAAMWRLRAEENASYEQIGEKYGIEAKTVQHYIDRAVRRGSLPPLPKGKAEEHSHAAKHPEEVAALVASVAATSLLDPDPKFHALKEACKDAGLKPPFVNAIIKRLRAGSYSPVAAEVKRLVGKDLVQAMEGKLALVLDYIDEVAVSQAGLKDLSIATSILTEKIQLLKNQPTQIIDFTMRAQLGELLPALAAEAKRRGLPLTVEGQATRIKG